MELDFGSDIRLGSNDQGDNSMRLRNIPGARETIAESPWIVQDPASLKGKWR
jgi:hypothetical protein